MATFQAKSGFTTDQETGCIHGYTDYEQCRTNYFLKQQNQILQNQPPSSEKENDQLKTEIETLNQELEILETKQVAPESNNAQNNDFLESAPVTYISILLVVVITTVFITRFFIKKYER